MTKGQAIEELTRAASLCPTTPLAEACRMAVEALGKRWGSVGEALGYDCVNCRHADCMPGIYPCSECNVAYGKPPSKWEKKEE